MKIKFALLIGLLSFLVLPTSVNAQMFWSTPAKINTSANNTIQPVNITGPNGYLHTAWAELDPAQGDTYYDYQNPGIYYSVWNGDAWSTPVKVSQNAGFAMSPYITVTGDNVVHLVWEEDSENASGSWGRILYSQNSGSGWSTPVSIGGNLDLTESWAFDPEIVKDAANNLHVVFNYNPPGTSGVNELYYTKRTGTSWSAPVKLSIKNGDDNIQFSSLAVDSTNQPHVIIWEIGRGGEDSDIYGGIYHTSFNGSVWSAPTRLSTKGQYPKITIDQLNRRHVVWVTPWFDDANQVLKNKVEYVRWDNSWTVPETISDNCYYSFWHTPVTGVTFDANNNIYVGWGELVGWSGDPLKGIQVSYKRWSGSTWSSPTFMRLAYDLDTPFLYRDKWDNQHFSWTEQNETSGLWEFWYSTVPVNAQSYNPSSNFSMTMNVTGDTLSIPSTALAASTTVSCQVGPLPASADPGLTTIPRSFTFRPHGTTFINGKVATAVINYTDLEIIGTDERNLKVYLWDSLTNHWSSTFATSVNRSQNKATVTLPHFSLYGFILPKIASNFKAPTPNVSGTKIPVKYQLVDQSTNKPAEAPTSETLEDGTVSWAGYKAELIDSQGSVLQTLDYSPQNGTLSYSTKTKSYEGQFVVNIPNGQYTVKVYLAGNEVGSVPFNYTAKRR